MSGFSLFDLFREDAAAQLAVLNDGLLRLERDPEDATVIEPLMRAAHSIKGAARIVDLGVIVDVAHAMEDCFVAVQKGTERIDSGRVDQLLRATDLLAAAAELDAQAIASWSDEHRGSAAALVAAMRAPVVEAAAPVVPDAPSAPDTPEARDATTVPDALVASAAPAAPVAPGAPAAPAAAVASIAEAAPQESSLSATDARTSPESNETNRPVEGRRAVGTESSEARRPEGRPPGGSGETAIRVGAERLERIMQLAGEIMVAGRQMDSMRQAVVSIKRTLAAAEDAMEGIRLVPLPASGERARDAVALSIGTAQLDVRAHLESVEELTRRTEELSASLYNAALGSRLRPFSDIAGGFPRMVRDLARQLGKRVRLDVVGEHVAVDRELLAKLEAPLSHLLRNALDHAIESPEDRAAVGKPAEARLLLEARHHAGRLMIRVVDDGRGIDAESIRRRAIERGLVPAELARGLGEREVLEFLFLPGFSTAAAVTEISGRGVGLDIVQTMAHEVGGSARIETTRGAGSVFTLVLPVAVSVVRAAIVEVAGEPLAFPLARIDRVVRFSPEETSTVQGRTQLLIDGHSVGLVDAAELLELGSGDSSSAGAGNGDRFAMLLDGDGDSFGLVVDRLRGEEDLVVRALDPRLGRVPHISSGSILERGDPCLIVDVEDLVASLRQLLVEGRRLGAVRSESATARRKRRILVVDDSATVREVERQLLARAGYAVETAVDGMDGWNLLSVGQHDLLVTDVDMPRMNGFELVRRVRADARLRQLPIIIVSYKDREEDRLRGLELGADAYLTKGSFQDDTFTSRVRDLVGEADA